VASHDLKEPLRGIHNYALFLLEDYGQQLDADGVQKLETLVRLSQRMEGLIESLLQLSRVGRSDLVLEEVDPNALLAGVTDLLQPRFEQTNTTLALAGPLPIVRADGVRVQEVFNNLISNAMKYNDKPAKSVTVGSVVQGGPNAPAQAVDLNEFHAFYVKDNGIGIDEKHHVNIFKLFKRLHAQDKFGGGTGAGLAIAKKMIEKHGGSLWVESTRGQGATFYFTIPK
jgi:light-regulated signal transduction histidine kinase (bacteriophytochrome)